MQSNPASEIAENAHGPEQYPVVEERRAVATSGAGDGLQLFRPQVLAERQTQYLGTVLLAPRRSHHFFTIGALLATAAIIFLLFYGEFTRKTRINGWLVPQSGMVRVFAPRPGVVTGLFMKEGQQVQKGQPLITLSGELQSSALGATQAEIVRRVAKRREALRDELQKRERLLVQQQSAYANRLAALREEQRQIEQDIMLMQSRVKLSERNVAMNRKLRNQGFISEPRLQMVEGDKLDQAARLGALQRQRMALMREQAALDGELNDLPLKTGTDVAAVERNIAAIEQEMAEAEARREIAIPAPQDGIVTTILAEMGGQANATSPLVSIVPSGSKLEAHLYGPSRAVGFVFPGQRVLLRYQAYPYQKFGHYEGTVTSISRSPVSPGDLPGLAGVASVVGATSAAEPVYRITVQLTHQSVTAYGQQMQLLPGMQLEADIALEKRKLYEWVLDPLYTITGKSHT